MSSPLPEDGPETRGHQLEYTAIAFIVIQTFFVGLRYVSRYLIRSRAKPGIDDYLMPLAWLFCIAICVCSILMVRIGGVGHHLNWVMNNDPGAIIHFTKLQIPYTIFYALGVNFPKIAILGLYLRIFQKTSHRIACYSLIGILSVACLAVVIITCVQCKPLAYMWDPINNPDGSCIDINSFWRWGSLPNIVTDFFMLVLPVPCIWKLQLSKKDKIGLILTFTTGSVGLVTSILRFTTFFNTDGQLDSTWTAIHLGAMSITEPGVYLIAACLPTYRSLFRSVRNRTGLGSSRSTRDQASALRSGDRSINLISVTSKHGKGFTSKTGSLDGFQRMEDEGKLVAHGQYGDASDKDTSSFTSLNNNDRSIHVERGYQVTRTHGGQERR